MPETIHQPNYILRKTLLGSILGIVAVAPVVGGVFGYMRGNTAEHHANEADLATVARDRRCLDLVRANLHPGSKTTVVRLTSLSAGQRADCQIEQAEDVSYYQNATRDSLNNFAPLGIRYSNVSISADVQLPTERTLQSDITKRQNGAADFNHARALEQMGFAAGGVAFAEFIALGTLGFVLEQIDKRRTAPAPIIPTIA